MSESVPKATTVEELNSAIGHLMVNIDLFHRFTHGDEDTTVMLGGKQVDSLRRWAMSEPEIKIVTRTCITCGNEPEWKPVAPYVTELCGTCKASFNYSSGPKINLVGQVSYCYDSDAGKHRPITDCPLWKAKIDEAVITTKIEADFNAESLAAITSLNKSCDSLRVALESGKLDAHLASGTDD